MKRQPNVLGLSELDRFHSPQCGLTTKNNSQAFGLPCNSAGLNGKLAVSPVTDCY